MPHQVEAYAMASGLRIEKMHLFEAYFPLGFENDYIVIVTGAGVEANRYPHFPLVLSSIREPIKERGIKIVQVGGKDDERIGADVDLCGATSLHQYFWLIKNCKLLISGDTSALHLAGHYNRPLVSIFGISHPNISGAYFGDEDKKRYILPDYKDGRPSFAPGENPCSIESTKPEIVSESIAELIGFEIPKIETIALGDDYKLHALVVVPNAIVRPEFFPGNILNLRYDEGGSEEIVCQQVRLRRCQIFTNKTMDVKRLSALRPNIERVIYDVQEGDDVNFVRDLQLAGIPFHLTSALSNERLGHKKLAYSDFGVIHTQILSNAPKDMDLTGLRFLTNRVILDNGKMYLSWAHRELGKSIDRMDQNVDTIIDTESFWKDQAFYYLFKEK